MKKNIYLVQINRIYDNSIYLPYSIGCLAAYAFEDTAIADSYKLNDFIFIYEDIETAVLKIKDPFIVGFSTYLWNTEYNLKLAERIKEKYPECLILFGGHNVNSDSAVMLEKYPFIDFLIHDEGEVPFHNLLVAIDNGGLLSDVPNLSYRDDDGMIHSNPKQVFDVADFPSPYLKGYFDSIIKNYDIQFQVIFETNRGCPYGCAYCDWGVFKSKLREFSLERVFGEIEWFAKNKIDYCNCADGNFGILKRDIDISKQLIKIKKQSGFPGKVCICFAKNSNDIVFSICKELFDNDIVKSGMLSVQTMNQTALENIGRKNLTFNQYEEMSQKYKSAGIPVFSELIMCLPGETYDSFCDGLCRLISLGHHMTINVYCCDILLNSKMAQKSYIEKHNIKSVRMPMCQLHIDDTVDEYPEYTNIIISTETFSEEDWVNANIFHSIITSFHEFGILQFFSDYINRELNISYRDFYLSCFDYITNNHELKINKLSKKIRKKYEELLTGEGSWGFVLPGLGKTIWPMNETIFIEIIQDVEAFFNEIEPFLSSFGIDDDIYHDLLLYQKEVLKAPGLKEKSYSLKYDFHSYFENILNDDYKPLEKKANTISVLCPDNPDSLFEYAKYNIWFGRRKKKMLCTNDMTVKYE